MREIYATYTKRNKTYTRRIETVKKRVGALLDRVSSDNEDRGRGQMGTGFGVGGLF